MLALSLEGSDITAPQNKNSPNSFSTRLAPRRSMRGLPRPGRRGLRGASFLFRLLSPATRLPSLPRASRGAISAKGHSLARRSFSGGGPPVTDSNHSRTVGNCCPTSRTRSNSYHYITYPCRCADNFAAARLRRTGPTQARKAQEHRQECLCHQRQEKRRKKERSLAPLPPVAGMQFDILPP